VLLHLDDPVLRALLYGRKTEAKNKNIAFHLDADTAVLPNFPLESHQIVEVFDNLLDNAFECTETLSEQRWIRVLLICQKLQSGQFENVFCVQNPYETLNIHAITSKKNFSSKGASHKGIGLKTVDRIVSGTGGKFIISCDNNIFTAKIVYWD
jgi:sensor histidine kinase regulating citrate/malate metabolism